MDYFLTEEQQMIVDIARQITDEKIIPQRAELDRTHGFPREILNHMAQADLFGVPIPEEYGGFGGGCFDIALTVEQFGRGCIGLFKLHVVFGQWDFLGSTTEKIH